MLRLGYPVPQFDVSLPGKLLLTIVAVEAIFLTCNWEICRLMNSKEGGVMGCDIIIGGLPNMTVCDRGGGGKICCKIA